MEYNKILIKEFSWEDVMESCILVFSILIEVFLLTTLVIFQMELHLCISTWPEIMAESMYL